MKGAKLAGLPPKRCILADLQPSVKSRSSQFPRGAPPGLFGIVGREGAPSVGKTNVDSEPKSRAGTTIP